MPRLPIRHVQFDLVPPQVPDALPLLTDEHAMLIPRQHQVSPLKVSIPQKWAASTPTVTVNFYWDERLVDGRALDDPDPGLFPLEFEVEHIDLSREGVYPLRYEVVLDTEVGQQSQVQWVNLDKTAPNQGSSGHGLELPDEVIANGITEEYLAQYGSLMAEIDPAWVDIRLEDKIVVHWTLLSPVGAKTGIQAEFEQVIATEADKQSPIVVVFTEAFLREHGNGHFSVSYSLEDRAGNRGPQSSVAVVDVSLNVPPGALRPPRIPQADDGLISRADACDQVMVVLDGYSVPVPGDELLVTFNTSLLAPVPAPTPGGFPVNVEVPWDILQGYGETLPYEAVVTWQVRRGAFLTPPSAPLNVDVDLRIPGPPNPSPCPDNAQLPSVTVKGSTGDNRIVSADAPGPVPVEVLLYSPANEHERLELFWGALPAPVADYEVMAGDVPGISITFQVPWASILAAGADPALPVAYTVSNGVNAQRSPTTSCEVDLAVEDATLPAPIYPEPDGYVGPPQWELLIGNVNCSAHPWRGLDIIVPADERFKEGDRVVLQWKGYSSSNLSESTALPGTVERYEKVVPPWTKDKKGRLAPQPIPFVIPQEHFRRCILPTSYRGQGAGQRAMGSGYAWYTLYSAGLPAIHNRHKASYCAIDLIRPGGKCPCTWDHYPGEAEDWCVDCDPSTDPGCTPVP